MGQKTVMMTKNLQRLVVKTSIALACALVVTFSCRVAQADNTYRLHSGDQINVVVYGDTSLTGPQTVLPDGSIGMPLVGKIHVSGQTTEQAAQTITYVLQKYVRHPVVTVSVTQQGPLNVLVLGNVKNPGKYALQPAGSMLTDAVAAAGGIGPVDGPYPDARIAASNGGSAESVSLEKLLHDGDLSKNIPLQDGEVVYIPSPATFNVYVGGAVDHPGEIPLNEGDNLAIAIIKAGNGPSTNGDYNNVKVVRKTDSGQEQTYTFDMYKLIQDNKLGEFRMQKGDIVYVPSINPNKHATGVLGQTFFYLTAGLRTLFPFVK
jgi:polysaccharide export outer membrane protein